MDTRRTGRTSLTVDPERLGRIRAAVRLVKRVTGRHYTVRQFVTEAVDAWLRQLEADYNGGTRLEPDPEPLPPGRSV